MAKAYHINGKGEPGLCRAEAKCPFGGEHYPSQDEARSAFEDEQERPWVSKAFKLQDNGPYADVQYGEIARFEVGPAIEAAFHYDYHLHSSPKGVASLYSMVSKVDSDESVVRILESPVYRINRGREPELLVPLIREGFRNPALEDESFKKLAASLASFPPHTKGELAARLPLFKDLAEDSRLSFPMRRRFKKLATMNPARLDSRES